MLSANKRRESVIRFSGAHISERSQSPVGSTQGNLIKSERGRKKK
jgi:hypothetical protein